MAKSMKGVLEQLIRDNDFLEDGLYHGYINLTSLATYLLPKVEKIAGRTSTVPSLTMTLSRIARDIQGAEYVRIRPDEMRIRTGIHYLSFHKSPGLAKELYSIYESVPESHDGDNFFSVVEGSEVFSVIFSRDFYGALESVRERHTPDIEEGDLAVLTIRISSRYVGQKGIVYFITKQLSFFGVNIVELHTSKTELTLLIQDEDKKKAISILG